MPLSPRPEQLLAAILSSSEDGLLSFSLDGTVQTWSRGAERLYGYTFNEMVKQPFARLLPFREIPAHALLLRDARCGNFSRQTTAERVHKDGSPIHITLQRTAIRNEQGEVIEVMEIGRTLECSDAVRHQGQLRSLLEQMPAVLWTTDRNLRITSNWGSVLQSGLCPGDVVGQTIQEYLKCEDARTVPVEQHAEALRGLSTQFEYRHKNRDFEIHLGPFRAPGGEIIGCIGAGIDITERKRQETEIHYQATHDGLTGLANYRQFVHALEREVGRAERSNRTFAVLLLDLDDLKYINDRFGHLAGNRALQRLADVMREQCRSTDLAVRYGGDEFALLLIEADPGMARRVADRIEGALKNDLEQPRLNVSIGIGIYPEDGRAGQQLLAAADRHLYSRKKAPRGHGVTSPDFSHVNQRV